MADDIEIAGQKFPWWAIPAAIGGGLGLIVFLRRGSSGGGGAPVVVQPSAVPVSSGGGYAGGSSGGGGGGSSSAGGGGASDTVQLAIINATRAMLADAGNTAAAFVSQSEQSQRVLFQTLAQGQATLFASESQSQRALFDSVTRSQLALANELGKRAVQVDVRGQMDQPAVANGGNGRVVAPVVATQPNRPVTTIVGQADLPPGVVQQTITGPGFSIQTNDVPSEWNPSDRSNWGGGSGSTANPIRRFNDVSTPIGGGPTYGSPAGSPVTWSYSGNETE
jgi:hypothetical protein